jgi:hypothetical protein
MWGKGRRGVGRAFSGRRLGSVGSRGRSGITTDFLSGLTCSGAIRGRTPGPVTIIRLVAMTAVAAAGQYEFGE